MCLCAVIYGKCKSTRSQISFQLSIKQFDIKSIFMNWLCHFWNTKSPELDQIFLSFYEERNTQIMWLSVSCAWLELWTHFHPKTGAVMSVLVLPSSLSDGQLFTPTAVTQCDVLLSCLKQRRITPQALQDQKNKSDTPQQTELIINGPEAALKFVRLYSKQTTHSWFYSLRWIMALKALRLSWRWRYRSWTCLTNEMQNVNQTVWGFWGG